jgi:hypothetical protein
MNAKGKGLHLMCRNIFRNRNLCEIALGLERGKKEEIIRQNLPDFLRVCFYCS